MNCIIKHSCEKLNKFAYFDEASSSTGIGRKGRKWRLKLFEVSSKASSRDHVVESDTVTVCTRNGLENKAILIEILDHRDREWSSKKTVTTKL